MSSHDLKSETAASQVFFIVPDDMILLSRSDPEPRAQCCPAASQTEAYSATHWSPACGTVAV